MPYTRLLTCLAVSLLTACTTSADSLSANLPSPAPSECQTAARQSVPDGVYQSLVMADSVEEAQRIALGNIANQIQMVIRSEAQSVSRKEAGQSVQSFNRRVTSVSEFVFDDYTILCQDFVTREVLVQYDDRPLQERVRSALQAHYPLRGWHLTGNPLLLESQALAPLRAGAGTDPAGLETGVYRDSQGWRLTLGGHKFRLRDEEWRALFQLPKPSENGMTLELVDEFGHPLGDSLFHEQEFRFHLRGKLPGHYYLNLLYIDAEGKVFEIRTNQPYLQSRPIMVPEPGIFTAELPEGFDRTVDDYVAIVSREPLDRPASPWLFNGWDTLFAQGNALGVRTTVR